MPPIVPIRAKILPADSVSPAADAENNQRKKTQKAHNRQHNKAACVNVNWHSLMFQTGFRLTSGPIMLPVMPPASPDGLLAGPECRPDCSASALSGIWQALQAWEAKPCSPGTEYLTGGMLPAKMPACTVPVPGHTAHCLVTDRTSCDASCGGIPQFPPSVAPAGLSPHWQKMLRAAATGAPVAFLPLSAR